ncbi:cytidine and deoxycytidylate deaminase family protein [Parvularcula bermudensis HTCC2503]|uniref:tRNA-specific adenosine deaminase n=1 Tax=Parvularcula bermudensis (strain ATCC BAA-594 / HTCC2503 / KCTC 12087) TaxID=314260 RepID=E0TBL5_PARBH|nr:tRNA adenosine(34) deaminase TadA [Parvularcula bermudensis]ADM08390.1 cytidine and deoxycytidylate deaminase family protein [Parvularcula bermudensis HTCC2503]
MDRPDLSASDADLERWMDHALGLASMAARNGEVPVGAVLLSATGQLIAEAVNTPIAQCDPTAHAELAVLRKGALATGNYRLTGTTLLVTLEPCAMCAGAICHARIGHLVYGADDPKGGAVRHGATLFDQVTTHHRPRVTAGIRADESAALLRSFFAERRAMTRPRRHGESGP